MPSKRDMKRTIAQSFAVSAEEKLAIEVLAAGEGMKGGTFARHLFYRGLALYVNDRRVQGDELEGEVFGKVESIIGGDKKLRRIKAAVKELDESARPGRVYASRNMPDEAETREKADKKVAGKSNRR